MILRKVFAALRVAVALGFAAALVVVPTFVLAEGAASIGGQSRSNLRATPTATAQYIVPGAAAGQDGGNAALGGFGGAYIGTVSVVAVAVLAVALSSLLGANNSTSTSTSTSTTTVTASATLAQFK